MASIFKRNRGFQSALKCIIIPDHHAFFFTFSPNQWVHSDLLHLRRGQPCPSRCHAHGIDKCYNGTPHWFMPFTQFNGGPRPVAPRTERSHIEGSLESYTFRNAWTFGEILAKTQIDHCFFDRVLTKQLATSLLVQSKLPVRYQRNPQHLSDSCVKTIISG